MPTSYKFFKNEVKEWFKNNVPANTRILDVGAGEGTYGKLLAHLGYDIDALEIWAPYINEFELWNYYGVVYDGDIRTFDYSNYDCRLRCAGLCAIPEERRTEERR